MDIRSFFDGSSDAKTSTVKSRSAFPDRPATNEPVSRAVPETETAVDETTPNRKSGRKKAKVNVIDDEDFKDVDEPVKAALIKMEDSPKKKRPRLEDDEVKPDVTDKDHLEDSSKPHSKKSFFSFKMRSGPAHPGSKKIPEGAENCLDGLTFVFTGEMDSLSRDEGQDLVKRYGGRVTSAVSGKTSYLVVGEEAGESKTHKAKSLNISVIDEDQLLKLIETSSSKAYSLPKGVELPPSMSIEVSPKKMSPRKASPRKTSPKKASPKRASPKKLSPTKMSPKKVSPKKISPKRAEFDNKPADPSESISRTQNRGQLEASGLWTEKYRPTCTKDFIGNKTNLVKLVEWLQAWNFEKAEQVVPKAMLISGPPGIGKTTAALLAAHEAGYDVVEFNASDTRSKRALAESMSDMTHNSSISEFFKSDSTRATDSAQVRRKVIVMDEVDGMSGGDRGGMGELIKYIRKTRVPIICICNDRAHPKVRNLANYCMDLRFRRPDSGQIRSRIMTIAFREQMDLKPNAIDELVANTQSDIRQILNVLSTWKLGSSSMSFDEAKKMGSAGGKDFEMNPFEIVRRFLSGHEFQKETINDLINLYFYDTSLIPLMVHENYLHVAHPHLLPGHLNAKQKNFRHLELISNAAESLSMADLVEQRIRREQEWGLSPTYAMFSCVLPGYFMHGALMGRIDFPSWLGNYSKEAKAHRLLRDLHLHTRLRLSASRQEFRSSYVPMLRGELVKPLIAEGMGGVDRVVQLMTHYYLTRDDWDSIVELSLTQRDPVSKITSTVKSAFTRAFNQASMVVPYPVSNSSGRGGRGDASGTAAPMHDPELIEEGPQSQIEDVENEAEDGEPVDQDDIKMDKMIKEKKVTGKSAASNASASAKAKRGRSK